MAWRGARGAHTGRHPLPGGAEVVVANGFARVRRTGSPNASEDGGVELVLPMPARRVRAHPRVKANAGRLALQRGPLVYAVEGVDHGGSIAGLRLPADGEIAARWRPDLLGGVVTLTAPVATPDEASAGHRAERLLAIPYFAWANRGLHAMAVWLPSGESR